MNSGLVREATVQASPVIRTMTDWMWEARSLHITNGYNCQKHCGGYQSERLKLLIMVLTGQLGGPGAYHQTYEGMKLEGGRAAGRPSFPRPAGASRAGIELKKGGKQPYSVGIHHEIIYGKSLERSRSISPTPPQGTNRLRRERHGGVPQGRPPEGVSSQPEDAQDRPLALLQQLPQQDRPAVGGGTTT